MIGGRRPLQGRKAGDRRVRVDRPHAPYFRYTGPGQLVAREAASVPRTARGRALRPHPRGDLRAAARERGGDRRAPDEEEGPRDLQLGRHQLVRVRDRGNPARPRDRRRGRAARLHPGGDRDRAAAGRRLGVVPPGLPGVSERRRRVRRRPDQPRPDLRPDRRGLTAHRLRDDRRGLDGRGDRPDPVGLPARVRHPDRDRVRVDRADHDREPPRPARVRQHLRRPDLPVRRPGAGDRRDRGVPDRDRDRGSRAARTDGRAVRHRDARRPAAAEGVRRRIGRADRRRGDRQRRARVQAARNRRTPRTR